MDARPIVQHGFASAMSETYGLRSPSTVSAKGYDSATAMDVDIATSIDDRSRRATSVLSMDDIEAAQTLEGLRSEFINSPNRPATLMHSESSLPPTATAGQPQPEPLLSLLTSTHPLISSAINGSVSAYATSKSYSRGFKYGAEFIERNIGSPVVNTVGSVSRKTGVEGGLRWALQRRETADNGRSSQNQQSAGQPAEGNMMDIEKALADPSVMHRQRSASELSRTETLPPYDDQRSPNYEELGSNNGQSSSTTAQQPQQQPPSTWQSRLVISTSGLGVAMSEESLRSLTYCLKWLKWANGRLSHAIESLKMALKDWDMSGFSKTDETSENATSDTRDPVLLSQHVQAVKEDVLKTLKQVVNIV